MIIITLRHAFFLRQFSNCLSNSTSYLNYAVYGLDTYTQSTIMNLHIPPRLPSAATVSCSPYNAQLGMNNRLAPSA